MSDKPATFTKSERLCSKKAIAELFENGKSFYSFPFQIIWIISPTDIPSPAQVAITVSKKSFRKAIKRNLIKRRIREAYRKNKQALYEFLESHQTRIIFMIIFKDSTIPEYPVFDKAIKEIISKLIKVIPGQETIC